MSGSGVPEGLSFERPILELVRKIEELKNLSAATGMDLNGEVRPLEERCERLTREIFSRLTPWEKVQLARHPNRPLTEDFISRIVEDFVDATITNDYETAVAISKGELNSQMAFMTGKIKVGGNMAKLMMNQALLGQFASASADLDVEY